MPLRLATRETRLQTDKFSNTRKRPHISMWLFWKVTFRRRRIENRTNNISSPLKIYYYNININIYFGKKEVENRTNNTGYIFYSSEFYYKFHSFPLFISFYISSFVYLFGSYSYIIIPNNL